MVHNAAHEVVRLVNDDHRIVKRVHGVSDRQLVDAVLAHAVVTDERVFRLDHLVQLRIHLALLLRAEFAVVARFFGVHQPCAAVLLNVVGGNGQRFGEGGDQLRFLNRIHELPMARALVHVVAALLEFLHVVGAQERGCHDKHAFVGLQAFRNGDGRARFAAAEPVIQEQTAIGRIHVQIILHDFLVR